MTPEPEVRTAKADIRRMQQTDIEKVAELGSSLEELQTGTESPQFYSEETLSRWIKSPNGILLVAEVKGVFAGFSLTAYNPDSRDGYIHTICVAPEFGRQYIGSHLLEKTLIELHEKTDCNHVYGLIRPTNKPSKKLFEKHGFIVGKTFSYVDRELPQG